MVSVSVSGGAWLARASMCGSSIRHVGQSAGSSQLGRAAASWRVAWWRAASIAWGSRWGSPGLGVRVTAWTSRCMARVPVSMVSML